METHDHKHPGPWRVMRVDSEFAGLLVAVGFLVMGFVSMPLAAGFVLGGIMLGVIVALILHSPSRKFRRVAGLAVIALTVFVLWWVGHNPGQPDTVSSDAFYVLLAVGFVVGAIMLGMTVALIRRSLQGSSDERQK